MRTNLQESTMAQPYAVVHTARQCNDTPRNQFSWDYWKIWFSSTALPSGSRCWRQLVWYLVSMQRNHGGSRDDGEYWCSGFSLSKNFFMRNNSIINYGFKQVYEQCNYVIRKTFSICLWSWWLLKARRRMLRSMRLKIDMAGKVWPLRLSGINDVRGVRLGGFVKGFVFDMVSNCRGKRKIGGFWGGSP